MKSLKSEIIQVNWLVEQIRQLDEMIKIHQSGGSLLMLQQYEARRLDFFKELINLLVNSTTTKSYSITFPLVVNLIEVNYPEGKRNQSIKNGADGFEKTIQFYQNLPKNSGYQIRNTGLQDVNEPEEKYGHN